MINEGKDFSSMRAGRELGGGGGVGRVGCRIVGTLFYSGRKNFSRLQCQSDNGEIDAVRCTEVISDEGNTVR